MASEQEERLSNELSLLESMYQEQVSLDFHAGEVTYTADGGTCKLRLTSGYLVDSLPEVIIAKTKGNHDLRNVLRERIAETCIMGEEVLDSTIGCFDGLLEERALEESEAVGNDDDTVENEPSDAHYKATIIVWLHHLLNTNKRKQALTPSSRLVSGVTKPGYPGMLVYSGPAKAVNDHVNELKQLNWQVFQLRLESVEEWQFVHGTGVVEVESMKEIVADIGDRNRDEFMKAMKIK